MHSESRAGRERAASWLAGALLAYGAIVIFLQTEGPAKLIQGALGYGGWVWGSANDLPTAWSAPTDLDEPLRFLYSALSLKQPVLPWLAWVAGCALLLWTAHSAHKDVEEPARAIGRGVAVSTALGLLAGITAVAAAWSLRSVNLLPTPDGTWTGSNFDEMVYYTQAELFTRGAWAYRDVFMAHPPGVVWAFSPALIFEKAWGGPAAFVAARQWLFAYSLLAVPLAWLVARRLGGQVSAVVAAFVLAFDGKAAFAPQSDRQLPNVGVLETLVNLTALGGLALYLFAPGQQKARRWWLLGAGILAGASAMCKVPGIALLLALILYTVALREWRDAAWLALGAMVGAGALALPFVLAAPGQMTRQVLFFQLLRPQEVRAGIDQASRIASYPEARLTLLLAGLGLLCATWLLWRDRLAPERDRTLWALPVLWAAPVVATFLLSRSYHSQYYTQWVPPLALIAGALASRQLWTRLTVPKIAAGTLMCVLALPLLVSQWRVARSSVADEVYRPTGAALASTAKPGMQAMAYDPGYTFAAGLPPARLPSYAGGDYIVDTAGYTVYTALELDRRGWSDLLRSVLSFERKRNEEDVLAQPEAQAALLATAVGADAVVLDQKIALPKLSAQSVRLLEGLSPARRDISFAGVLKLVRPEAALLSSFNVSLDTSYLVPLKQELPSFVMRGDVEVNSSEAAQIGLYWRPHDYISANLRVVVRLVDAAGGNARQVDTEPAEGQEHTQGWRPGFVYPDIRNVPLQGLNAGRYSIHVRLYDPVSSASSSEVVLGQTLVVR